MRVIPVYRFMTPNPQTIHRDEPLAKAHLLMRLHKIRHLPVVDDGVLVGVVSQRDLALLESVRKVDLALTRVEEAMTPDPYSVLAETPLLEVTARMAADKYGVAIVMHKGEVIGIFSAVDGLRALTEILEASQPAATAAVQGRGA